MAHPFEVGGVYANRRGTYEVIAVHEADDELVIRYSDSGEETGVSLRTQSRIVRNMGWEAVEARRAEHGETLRQQRGYGVEFAGLRTADFSTTTEGTTWRSRANLAGRVARLISHNTPYTFLSWAIYGWPVAFIMDEAFYSAAMYEQGVAKAKFTIELDEAWAYYGLYFERNCGPMDESWDWNRLWAGLQKGNGLRQAIELAEAEYGLRFLARESSGEKDERFHFANGRACGARPLWDEENPGAIPLAQRLAIVAQVLPECWVEMYLLGRTPREEALQARTHLAYTMGTTMRCLLPLYAAATGTKL